MSKILTFLFLILCSSIPMAAKPAQVIIICHGEQPEEGEVLTLKGRERAWALVPYFLGTPELLRYGPPVALYVTKVTPEDQSKRTQETLTPLASSLRLPICNRYKEIQYRDVAEDILTHPDYDGRMVLICWERKHIPLLAYALGIDPMPQPWPSDVFDWVWVIDMKRKPILKSLSQALLFGDSPPTTKKKS